jgi:hypothetical protein
MAQIRVVSGPRFVTRLCCDRMKATGPFSLSHAREPRGADESAGFSRRRGRDMGSARAASIRRKVLGVVSRRRVDAR